MIKLKDIVFTAAILVTFGIAIWSKLSSPQIAFVNTAKLMEGFKGMKEASDQYEANRTLWKASIDSLQNILQMEVYGYKKDSSIYNKEERIIKKERISRLQYELYQLNQKTQEKATKEDERMTLGVLNQINSFVKNYGVEKGYTIIFGTLETGNILYAKDAVDITKEVLKGLNEAHDGAK